MKKTLLGCALALVIAAPSASQDGLAMPGGDLGPMGLNLDDYGLSTGESLPFDEQTGVTLGFPGSARASLNWRLLDYSPRTRPINPSGVEENFRNELANLEASCPTGLVYCSKARSIGFEVAALKGSSHFSPCSVRGSRYVAAYPALPALPQISVPGFDIACFASLEPRLDGSSVVRDAPPEFFLRSGGGDGQSQGALKAVGVLEVDKVPFCSALLRPDRTLVTAAHCYSAKSGSWDIGAVTVRVIDGSGERWSVDPRPVDRGDLYSKRVGDDWAVFRFQAGPTFSAPPSTIKALEGPAEVTVLAPFKDYAITKYADDGSISAARRAVRWPRAGLCRAIEVMSDCIRLVCQTVEGFSGTPIFRADSDPEKVLEVVGFISGAIDQADFGSLQCGIPNRSVTVASFPNLHN